MGTLSEVYQLLKFCSVGHHNFICQLENVHWMKRENISSPPHKFAWVSVLP
jgi:hypothetical protein